MTVTSSTPTIVSAGENRHTDPGLLGCTARMISQGWRACSRSSTSRASNGGSLVIPEPERTPVRRHGTDSRICRTKWGSFMLKRTMIAATTLAIAATTIAMPAAYAGPPQPTPLVAGCFDSKVGTLDLKFDGAGLDNAWLTSSTNGLCQGLEHAHVLTIVVAKSQVAAKAQCAALGKPYGLDLGAAVGRVNKDWGYSNAPADYWMCAAHALPLVLV